MTDITFIEAVIVWLSDFPNIPLSPGDPYQILANRNRLIELICVLCGCNVPLKVEKTTPMDLMLSQIKLHNHSTSYGDRSLAGYIKSMPFEDLFHNQSTSSVVFLCKILYLFSTRVSKYVPFAITSLGFLADNHREAITDFFAHDILERSQILIEKINGLQDKHQDNQEIKDLLQDVGSFVIESRSLPVQKVVTKKFGNCDLRASIDRERVGVSRESTNTYVDEEYLESLKWELQLTEDVLHQVTEKARQARIELQENES